jgi:glycosyltransferase involved in cell wall biosynthesis
MARSLPARVLMTADAMGGVWQYALELARGLAGRGVRTTLAVMGRPPSPAQLAAAGAVPGLALVEVSPVLEWMPGVAEDELDRAGERLLDLERRTGADLVHVNGFHHAALPWRAPCLAVAHSCVASWWRAVKGGDAPPEWDAYRRRVRRGLAAADEVAAPSEAFLRELEALHLPLPRARVIHNGRAATDFEVAPKEALVFGAGRLWDEGKNLAALDRVARRLEWPVVIAGDSQGPDGQRAACGDALHVGVLDQREMAAWLGRAAVFALPARYEPFGLCALEAALAACALVLGDIPTLRELWRDAALFVPPDDDEALVAALARLERDAGLTIRLGLAARNRALRLSAERMTDGYALLYAEMLAPSPALRPPANA